MSPPRPTTPRLGEPVVSPTAVVAPRSPSSDPIVSLREIENTLRSFPRSFSDDDLLKRLLRGYFREARIQSSLRFGPTVLEVDDSPDLQVRDGAGICAEARIHEGQLSFHQALRLGGFSALGGFIDFCSVDSDAAGKIHLKSCVCSLPKDSEITDAVLKGPLGRAFPEKKIHPVALEDLLKALIAPASGPSSAEPASESADPLLSALRSIQLKAEIPSEHWVDDPEGTPGGSCHPLTASIEAYLDIPKLQDNLAAGLWRSFDFSGLERGSKVLWPRFDLSQLPLPAGWSISKGEADLEIRHFPENGETKIQIRHLRAQAKIPALFGESEVVLEGQADLKLQRGGAIELDFKAIHIEAPLNSMAGAALPNLSAVIDAKILGKLQEGGFALDRIALSFHDLQLDVPENRRSPLGHSGLSWQGTLLGQGEMDYVAASQNWERVKLALNGELSVHGAEGRLFQAEGIAIDLNGSSESLTLQADALSLSYGALAIRPQFSLELKPEALPRIGWLAQGTLSAKGINIPLSFNSATELHLNGEEGKVQLDPIEFRFAEKNWTRKGRAEAQWSSKGLSGRLKLPDLPGGNALDLKLSRLGDSERLSGSFQFEPADLSLNPEIQAKDITLSGSFITDPWSGLFAKPRMTLDARAQASLDGALSGPIRAELQGSLSYSPTRNSIFLWLNPRRDSAIHLGPMALAGESRKVEADLPLKGTWQAVLLPHGVLIGGRGVGIESGEIRISDGATKTPWVQGLTLLADQLWSVQNWIAYAGGDGIRLDGRVDSTAWLGSSIQGLGTRKVFLVTDQLPLSAEAYWNLFAKSLKSEGVH